MAKEKVNEIEEIEKIEDVKKLEEYSRKKGKSVKACIIIFWVASAIAIGLSLFFDFNQDLFQEIETRKIFLLGGVAPCVVIGTTAAEMTPYERHLKSRADERIERLKK